MYDKLEQLIETKKPAQLLEQLRESKVDFQVPGQPVQTVVLSCVDPEPAITIYTHFLKEETRHVLDSLLLVKYITQAQRVVLAVPRSLYAFARQAGAPGHHQKQKPGDIDIYRCDKHYPYTLPVLLVKDIVGTDCLESSLFLGVEKAVAAVKALLYGEPFDYKTLTLTAGGTSTIEKVQHGTPLCTLLESRQVALKDGDKVINGGPFRGMCLYDLQVPVSAATDCIVIQDAAAVVDYSNHPCTNCGRCVKVCPVDLDVNVICRYAEFSFFQEARDLGAAYCIACGMCAYSCPARRSLVQFIQLAQEVT